MTVDAVPVGKQISGLALLASIAGIALLVGTTVPLLSPLVVTIVLGAAFANIVGLPDWAAPGVVMHTLFLEVGIVLLGAELSLQALLAAGPILVLLIVSVVSFGVVTVEALTRIFDLDQRTGSLLAAGASICGVSAIVAIASATDVTDSRVAYAAGTILLFDAITLAVFPPLGYALGITGQHFGIWIGLSMFSTGPVTAAGFSVSQTAGEWATITKLARNSIIGLLAVAYSLRYLPEDEVQDSPSPLQRVWGRFPKFLVGFLALVALASTGALSAEVKSTLGMISDVLFLLAFAGVGFDIRLSEMRDAGIVPIGIVGVYLVLVSFLSYFLVFSLF